MLRAGFPYIKTIGMRRITGSPLDLAFGADGTIYILCRSDDPGLIRKLNYDDDNLGEIRLSETEHGQCLRPAAVTLDRDGSLFLSDQALHHITVLNPDGEFLGKWGEHGDGDGQLDRPSGIAFDSEDDMYVVDTANHRVQKFTKDGKFLMKWGGYGDGEGEFNMPWGITVDEFGDVYVADWRNDRVQKFNAEGEFIFSLGESGSDNGQFDRPTGVEVDEHGDIYVADSRNNRVQLFNAERRWVENFIGDAGLSKSAREYMLSNATPMRYREMSDLSAQKRFRSPRSVKVDDQGRMFVTDYNSFRVQVYQKDAIPLDSTQIVPPKRSPSLTTT